MNKIEFGFSTSDNVFFLSNNKVVEGEIVHVGVNMQRSSPTTIRYTIVVDDRKETRSEGEIFKTKEDLIKSL